jgi:hypothetical protein
MTETITTQHETAADPFGDFSTAALHAEVLRRRRASRSRDARANPASQTGQYVETEKWLKMVRRLAAGAAKRVGQVDPAALAELAALVDALKTAETDAARALNDSGFSWADIGAAQGINRESAWKKYRRSSRRHDRRSTKESTS